MGTKGHPQFGSRLVSAAVVEALSDAQVQKRISDIGQEVVSPAQMNPQALAAHHKTEMDRWQALIKAGDQLNTERMKQ
jgi:tripartite-type tricarboxylate transporter receptor subunit TctC